MKTIMLLSGGRFNLSIIGDSFWLKLLKSKGYKTLYLVKKENIANEWADKYWQVDEWDYEFVKKLVLAEKVDLILHFSDFAGSIVSRLNEEFGLPGITPSQYRFLHNKIAWSSLLADSGLAVLPLYLITEKAQFKANSWNFPIVVKATASSSSISDKPYGYQFYPCLQAFEEYLSDNGLLEDFLSSNREGTAYGQYIIQKKLDFQRYYFVNLIISSGQVVFSEFHEHKVYEKLSITL